MCIPAWIAAATAAVFWNSAALSATITTDPQDSSVLQGESLIVELVGQDFTDATVGGGADLVFDPSVLQAVGVTFGHSAFDFAKTVQNIDNASGKIDSILVSSFLTDPSGNFNIATIEFMAVGIGSSILDLGPSTFSAPWLTATDVNIDPTFVDGSATVSAVPLPAAIWMMTIVLGLLGAAQKRKRG